MYGWWVNDVTCGVSNTARPWPRLLAKPGSTPSRRCRARNMFQSNRGRACCAITPGFGSSLSYRTCRCTSCSRLSCLSHNLQYAEARCRVVTEQLPAEARGCIDDPAGASAWFTRITRIRYWWTDCPFIAYSPLWPCPVALASPVSGSVAAAAPARRARQ
jgi:hypothetical protein